MTQSTTALLAGVIQLEQQARQCVQLNALHYLIVNDTYQLVPYRQAMIWRADTQKIDVMSGVAVIDKNAPFVVWLNDVIQRHLQQIQQSANYHFDTTVLSDYDHQMWHEYLPAYLTAIPLFGPEKQFVGMVLFAHDEAWTESTCHILNTLSDAYGHAWWSLLGQHKAVLHRRLFKNKKWKWGTIAGVVILCLFPIRQSVLVPAEVTAHQPEMVRAPIQGVVDHIDVKPNQLVKKGDLLLTLDARDLEGKLESAKQALAVASAELRQNQQQAVFDNKSKTSVGILQGKYDQALADAQYIQDALSRNQIRASRDGIVIFDDPNDWIGKPVSLGERIMMVANPKDAELEVQLPVADAINLSMDTPIKLFLNIAPASPLTAKLSYIGYRAMPTPEGLMVYRGKAAFLSDHDSARVGLKGTAKLYGHRTIMLFYLLRRPLASLRAWIGW